MAKAAKTEEQKTTEAEQTTTEEQKRYHPDNEPKKVPTLMQVAFLEAINFLGSSMQSAREPEYKLRLTPFGVKVWKTGKPQQYMIVPLANCRSVTCEE